MWNNIQNFAIRILVSLCFLVLVLKFWSSLFPHKSDFQDNFNSFQPNSIGFRDENPFSVQEMELAAAQGKRHFNVLVLGDEFTVGRGVAADKIFTEILEDKLRLNNSNLFLEVINAGANAYNTEKEIELFMSKLKLLEPDVIMLMYSLDDAIIFKRESFKPGNNKDLQQYYEKLYGESSKSWKRTQNSLLRLANYLHESHLNSPKNMQVLFVMIPEVNICNSNAYDLGNIHSELKTLVSAYGFSFLDLSETFRSTPEQLTREQSRQCKELWLSIRKKLLSSKGHQAVADALYKGLL